MNNFKFSSLFFVYSGNMDLEDNIYVAGHRGLLGSAIVRLLNEKGYKNIITRTSKELDLRKSIDVEDFFNKEIIDVVILAAAKVGSIEENKKYPAEFLLENLQIETNVISSAFKNGIKNLLFVSTSCIYPQNSEQPLKEEYLFNGPLEAENEAYGIAKIAGLKLCEYYNKEYGLNYITVNPTNLYGVGDVFDPIHSHVIPANILKIHNAKIENKEFIQAWGSGKAYREFLYVDDAADAIIFLLNNYEGSGIVNLGTGNSVQIKDLLNLIKEVVGYQGEIRFDTTKAEGILKRELDISKLKELGWNPKIDLKEGLKRTYDYYLSQSDKE